MISHVLAVAALPLEADGVEDGLQLHPTHGRGLLNQGHFNYNRTLLSTLLFIDKHITSQEANEMRKSDREMLPVPVRSMA